MSKTQHADAKKLLSVLASQADTDPLLTYKTAAKALGRDPKTDTRATAQVCDLLDSAATLAGVPLLALVKVRLSSGKINPKAWNETEHERAVRPRLLEWSMNHHFQPVDFKALGEALDRLAGMGNRASWAYVRSIFSPQELERRVTGQVLNTYSDAIDDIGTDTPIQTLYTGMRYARDPKVRKAVILRAGGKCEFCGVVGFKCSDGSRYLECHHITALAAEGDDRVTNVIALCPKDHREAHYGERRLEIEKEMMTKMAAVIGG